MLLTSDISSEAHRGMGVPQYRLRETFQSLAFLSQFPNRFSPTYSGTLRYHNNKKGTRFRIVGSNSHDGTRKERRGKVNSPSSLVVVSDESISVLLDLDHPDRDSLVEKRSVGPIEETHEGGKGKETSQISRRRRVETRRTIRGKEEETYLQQKGYEWLRTA